VTNPLRAARYQRRIVDDELDELAGLPAIALDGAKAVGKSATAAERTDRAFALEDDAVRETLATQPRQVVDGGSVLIDEWQRYPPVWDVVRRAVDAGAPAGQFFLTGSASLPDPGTHSGAGRIVIVRMRPMSLVERSLGPPSVSLSELLQGGRPKLEGSTPVDLSAYVEEILASGFPGIRPLALRARSAQLASYVRRATDHDIGELGRSVRNPTALQRWLAAYAAATATTTSYEKIRNAATAGSEQKPARATVDWYRDALERLYLIEPLQAWLPTWNRLSELAASPKHHLVDPALATTLLGVDGASLLGGDQGPIGGVRDGTLLGALFESLVTQSVRVYGQRNEARIGHFRTHRGDREVDLVVERRDRRVIAIEVKLTAVPTDADVEHLLWLQSKLGDEMIDAVVVTAGPYAYRRADGIGVVPAALLGP
jgi:uncharacterized protein